MQDEYSLSLCRLSRPLEISYADGVMMGPARPRFGLLPSLDESRSRQGFALSSLAYSS